MSAIPTLVTTLKRLLKHRGLTYAQLAVQLQLSEASVKRLFATQRFSVQTLEQICTVIGMDLGELIRATEQSHTLLSHLSEAQEAQLVADTATLLVAVCVINHWTPAQIVATYRLSEAECIRILLMLDRLGLIRLLPENQIRLLIARDFAWLPDGPIRRYFRDQAQADFLDHPFVNDDEWLRFQHAMLTPAACARLKTRLQRLVQEVAEQHQDCVDAPIPAKQGYSVLMAMRSWEPAAFQRLRRQGAEIR